MLDFPPLYPITGTNSELPLSEQVSRFACAGFPIVQFRAKSLQDSELWAELHDALGQAGENGGWPLIVVNDRADLAVLAASGGLAPWGLHLGQTDLPASSAARLPGLEKLHIGTSTHNPDEWSSIDSANDHAGVGPIRPTATKRDHVGTIGLDGLQMGCFALRNQGMAPIAIGGLTMDDALPCYQAGAESLAMAQALSPETLGLGGLPECLWQA